MATTGIYKLDDGTSLLANCFPVRSYFRPSKEGAGNWLVAQRNDLQCKFNAIICSNVEDHIKNVVEHQRMALYPTHTNKGVLQKSELQGTVLNGLLLMDIHCVQNASDLCSVDISDRNLHLVDDDGFQTFDNVAYINASGNLLSLDNFQKFPSLRELELSLNALRKLMINHGDFAKLQVLDLSYNNLSPEDVLSLGLLPQLKVLHLTGNGLHTLPPDVTEPFMTSSANGIQHAQRFKTLEVLMLDDNMLSHPSVFASLASLKRLKHLNLDKNGIREVPYLQQVMESDYPVSADFRNMSSAGALQKRSPAAASMQNSEKTQATSLQHMKLDTKDTALLSDDESTIITELNTDSSSSFIPHYQTFSSMAEDVLPRYSKESSARMKSLSTEFVLPFPELRFLSLADNKITEEEDLLAAALFPSLNELVICGNPIRSHRNGVNPLLHTFLQQKLGINITWKKTSYRKKLQICVPLDPNRKVNSHIPKVPKQPLMLESYPLPTLIGKSLNFGESKTFPANHPNRLPLLEPLPQAGYSFVTEKDKETEQLLQNVDNICRQPGRHSPANILEMGIEDTEAFFMTQVDDFPDSEWEPTENNILEEKKEEPEEIKNGTILTKYKGYEELLDAKPDPNFIEPSGIQQNVQALNYALQNLLVYHSPEVKLKSLQKSYVPDQKKIRKLPEIPLRREKTEQLENVLTEMKKRTTSEVALGKVLQKKSNIKEYKEAVGLLKELQKIYKNVYTNTVNQAAQLETQYQETFTRIKETQLQLERKGSRDGR
ncbi:X-ray radiation resistance-associated protein 1 [Protopterus annectens]|uniref:X-ray radiation resistance-associated protein 1 n=1 Tax=Protopterus annectens TaxID=7888 RepID=UPI001CFAE6A4|nr:X-ray radiation resistance-associated protein 1 [Protopterus annectens]XP_043928607.1 X-ray radiation resistance-associated protein 1 [Protopterus annectens]